MTNNSEPYENFAEIYDQVMCSVDYEAWADYVEELLDRFSRKPVSIIDLACGTGSSTLPFARRGYRVAGVDLSSAMLNQARRKAVKDKLAIPFYERDLGQLNLPEKYDLALLFQDGFNYLLSDGQLSQAMKQVYRTLNPDSLFIFDVTQPGLRSGSDQNRICFADQDDFALILESDYSSREDLWSARLTVFQQTAGGLYRKYQEAHQEKDHNPDRIIKLLEETGFTMLGLYPSFSLEPALGSEPKLTFVAEK